ncbi:DnaJ family domain-containing protein [Sporosarcina sp. JAI121]|uniref:DnaJ family domain-containing protein n=1 Tax=Sporosarcina sp. JAI121 TaxID=2723064 RepID=UPI0015C94D84|nr:DnaJ family domain-containing protein [Sporosarcina sp. JAI121]NYF25277.1 hypothetical protein [Sporosarcina sp. JAI121]
MKEGNVNPPYNDLIGDILKEYTKKGGMDNLQGHGKPLPPEYFSGDTFQHFQRIAKDAGYLPYWLKLQHEIRDEAIAIAGNHKDGATTGLEMRLAKLNAKIFEYNKTCPPPMQKGPLLLSTVHSAVERWK